MSKTKKLFLILAALVVAVLIVVALRPAPVSVSAFEVVAEPFADYVEDEGRTGLRETYTVSAPIGGFLRRVEPEPGDPVDAGDVLFRIEPSPAPALDARAREQARETLQAARARLQAAEAEHENARAEARFAANEYERQQALYERSLVSATEMDRALSARDRSRSAERAAGAAVEAARFEVENARAVLEITEGERSPDEERVLSVAAPVAGVILRRDRCCEGVVQAGERILEIGNLDDLEIQVDLLSMDAVRVRPDMRVEIERWGGETVLEGRVRRVEPAGFRQVSALGVEEQRVPVRVQLISERERWEGLGEGYRVEARFILWEDESVVQVPSSALFRRNGDWHVYVIENDRARARAVEPGRRSGLRTQILEGLEPGEVVIAHPADHHRDGMRVDASS
ncbi:MAG: efflux RND transporter periplasmic adaptor subunit [Wenzhouxiangella sp.]|nr:MAG: efflux RND transporter periplasmic adaptor subunit [Wenzhouxiangella sp.]